MKWLLLIVVLGAIVLEAVNAGLSLLNAPDDLAVFAGALLIVVTIVLSVTGVMWLYKRGWL